MIVEPTLLRHPKYVALKRGVGELALEYLTAIWGHCQEDKRGENWGKASPDYVEIVAGYHGEPGRLWEALRKPCLEGGKGFVEQNDRGEVIIHDWNDHNKALIINWNRNPNGRRGKTSPGQAPENPPGTRGFPNGKPPPTQGVSDRTGQDRTGGTPLPPNGGETGGEQENAGAPTPEEMVTALMTRGLLLKVAERYHRWHTEKQTWLIHERKTGQLILRDWKREVMEWQEQDRAKENAGRGRRGLSQEQAEEELENVRAELQWQEDKERKAELKKRWRELQTMVGANA